MRFAARPYLPAIYAVRDRNLVIRASRQVEKSTFLANTILFEACANRNARILFVSPRAEQASVFSHIRLMPMVRDSPLLARHLLGKQKKLPVTNVTFANGAQLYLRAAFHSADACRGLSANLLLVDEVQDIAAGDLPVLAETLSHAEHGRMILTGTPKLVDNHLEGFFSQSTANCWTIVCDGCQNPVRIDERALGPVSLICNNCQTPLDAAHGAWVPRNPQGTWGEGFTISHPMVPWLDFHDVLERQRAYDPVRFRNEVLGLPTTLGDHVVTRAELESCCGDDVLSNTSPFLGMPLYAGVDWGGGMASRTVLVVGTMRSDFTFHILHIAAFQPQEDPQRILDQISRQCREFRVVALAADGNGNGHVYNRLLYDRLRPQRGFYSIFYSQAEQRPTPDGVMHRWTVNRSASIGVLFGRVKRKQLIFPRRADVDAFLDEFACETAVYDEHARAIKYTHPENQRDDAMHATNYALLIATRAHNAPSSSD
ncbi:MAG TPA: phage terminase large subunit family protein [Pirellulales bacterium]|jgi:hypothetical protein